MDYYDIDGRPLTMKEYLDIQEKDRYKRVGQDVVGPFLISTVWLGMDHAFQQEEGPLIFETMVFLDDDYGNEILCYRYKTKEAAREGHAHVVKRVKEVLHPQWILDVLLGAATDVDSSSM